MTYKLFILRNAQKQLAKLPANDYRRIKSAILNLVDNPKPIGSKKLKGREAWRIRCGVYRIIYEICDDILTITIITIKHRKDVYK